MNSSELERPDNAGVDTGSIYPREGTPQQLPTHAIHTRSRKFPFSLTTGLLLVICGFALLYLLLLYYTTFPGLRLYDTPLLNMWLWPLSVSPVPSHSGWLPQVLLGLLIVALVGLYACAIALAWYQKTHSRPFLLIFGGAVLFGLILLCLPRLFSDDVFTYIFSGRILAVYAADPFNTAPAQYGADPYLQWVISGRYTVNIYAPLLLCIASLLVSIHAGPLLTFLLFKGMALAAHLGSCLLIWAILGKIAPERRLLGTLLYAWNPLALIELVGNAHSEGVLLLLLLLATWLYMQNKGWSRIGACFLLGLAIATNLITLLLVPLFIWFDVYIRRTSRVLTWGVCWRLGVMLIPALALTLPFWRGATTFFAITSTIDMEHFVHAPVGVLAGPVRALFRGVATWLHFPAFLQPITAADMTLRGSAASIFVLIYGNLFGQMRRMPSATVASVIARQDGSGVAGIDGLLRSWGVSIFWFMVLVSGWFWPWYVLWMLWIVVLLPLDTFPIAILMLSGTALLLYPFLGLIGSAFSLYQAALIFGIPLLYLIIVGSRKRYKGVSYER